MPRVPARVRQAIIKSKQFQDWWAARRLIRPIPADPFRAFMIDLALTARVLPKDLWKPRTNWSDYPPIDLPRGIPMKELPRKKRMPSRKERARMRKRRIPKPARPVPETPLMKEIKGRAEVFAEKFHLPRVEMRFVPERGVLGRGVSHYFRGYPAYGVPPHVQLGMREAKKVKGQVFATLFHELGHHAVKYYRGDMAESIGIRVPTERMTLKEQERTAWRVADPFLQEKRAMQKFFKKYTLGTYLGTSPKPKTR